MRIRGELLKLGISVSATTVATALRASGLGPAPRRIGPSWSEFLRAQAQILVGDGLSPGVDDDSLDGDAPEPSGRVQDAGARQVEADCDLSSAKAGQPRLASHPQAERRRSASPPVAPATGRPMRQRPAHWWHARDGPGERSELEPQPSAQSRRQSHVRRAPRPRQPPDCTPREVPRIFSPAASAATDSPLSPELRARTEFLYPTRRMGGDQGAPAGSGDRVGRAASAARRHIAGRLPRLPPRSLYVCEMWSTSERRLKPARA
jgi:hypothetical protein